MTDVRRAGGAVQVPTMEDVARLAGVSLGTVSNTLNNPDKVRESTRARVQLAISHLGFVPNDAARSLAAGTSTTIGLILVDMGNSFFVDIARGAEQVSREHGMNLLIANSDVDAGKQESYFEVFEKARVAGVLLAPLDTADAGRARPTPGGRPLVLVNWRPTDGAYSGVAVDEELGGYLAAQHLLDLGRRSLCFAGGPASLLAVRERARGAQRAVDAVVGARLQRIETNGLGVRYGTEAALQLLAEDAVPDGIIAASDLIAVGCIQTMERVGGRRVPEDVAVVGYDNNHFASESLVPVSTISQPGEEMGRAAARLLLEEIEGPGLRSHRTLVVEPHLIARRSSLGSAWTPEPD